MSEYAGTAPAGSGRLTALNTRYHRPALWVFAAIVVGHWAEHVSQAIQIWLLGWPTPEARGVLGMAWPWLVESEWLHYGYALIMLVVLVLLRPGFVGRSRFWWNLALGIQVWHHIEHLLLLVQAQADSNLAGRAVPTSMLQLVFPRVELHLVYNALVTAPMVMAMVWHMRPRPPERARMDCDCALEPALAESR